MIDAMKELQYRLAVRMLEHLAEIGLEGLIRTQKGLGYLVDET